MTPSISVVVPTYNRKHLLKGCLNSLFNQSYPANNYEIIVIDDGSTDGTAQMVKEIKATCDHKIIYLRQDRKGPAIARNLGIKAAKGKIICFLDDDCIADVDLLSEVYKSFSDDFSNEVGGVKGRVEPIWNERTDLSYALGKYIYVSERSLSSNNLAYKKSVLHEVGLFDETFPIPAWEDVDLGNRVMDKGYKILYNPKAIVWHPHEKDFVTFKRKCYINGVGLSYFFRKWLFRKPSRSLLSLFNDTRYIVHFPLLRKRLQKEDMYTRDILKGIKAYYTLKGFIKTILFGSKTYQKYE